MRLPYMMASSHVIRAEALNLLKEIHPSTHTQRAASRFVSVALQHQHSIVILLETKNPSSALALLRCMHETCSRGAWIAKCATEDQARSILREEFDFKAAKIYEETQDYFGFELEKEGRKRLHSYTHTGFYQLKYQRFSDGEIGTRFHPLMIKSCLYLSTALLTTFCRWVFVLHDRPDLSDRMWEHYVDRCTFAEGED